MSGNFSRDKGQRAERLVANILKPIIQSVYGQCSNTPIIERNVAQSQRGGHDLIGLDWLAIEVKHQETLAVETWWAQCKAQATRASVEKGFYVEPVLIWKQNNVKMNVRLFGYVQAGESRVRCPVVISMEAFLVWFKTRLQHEVKQSL